MIAQVRAGEGAAESADAEAAAERVLELVAEAEVVRAAMEELGRTAALASTFDPDAEEAAVAADRTDFERRLAETESRAATLQSELDGLREQIDEQLAAAREARLEETRLRSQALRADAIERASIVERAVESRRVAEQRERRAAELELRADRLERQNSDVRAEASGFESAIANIDELEGRIAEAAETERESAQRRGRSAAELREDLDSLVRQIRTALEGGPEAPAEGVAEVSSGFLPEIDEAIGKYEQAVRAASSAGERSRDLGSMTRAGAQQALASLHILKALVLNRVAELAGDVQESELAQSSRTAADEAAESAGEALAAAASGAGSLRPQGAVADRLALRGDAMQSRADLLQEHGVAVLLDPDLAPTPDPADDGGGMAPSGDDGGWGAPGAGDGDQWGTGDDDWGSGGGDDWGTGGGAGGAGGAPGMGGMPSIGGGGGGGFPHLLAAFRNFGKKPEEQ